MKYLVNFVQESDLIMKKKKALKIIVICIIVIAVLYLGFIIYRDIVYINYYKEYGEKPSCGCNDGCATCQITCPCETRIIPYPKKQKRSDQYEI